MLQWVSVPRGEMAIDSVFSLSISVTPTTVGDNFIGRFFDADGMDTGIDPVIGTSVEEVKARVEQKISDHAIRALFNL
jgi:hypothetical protein